MHPFKDFDIEINGKNKKIKSDINICMTNIYKPAKFSCSTIKTDDDEKLCMITNNINDEKKFLKENGSVYTKKNLIMKF